MKKGKSMTRLKTMINEITISGIILLLGSLAAFGSSVTEDTLQYGRFGAVHLYYDTPKPDNIVLFVSGDGGWNLGVVDMARSLASLNAMVAGINIVHYLGQLESSSEHCSYPASDFEMLSKYIQKRYNYENYTTPILVGYSSGATLVYAILVQAPSTTFRGGVSMGFCPDLPLTKPFCRGNGLEWTAGSKGKGYSFLPANVLEVPWVVLQGDIDQVCSPGDTDAFVKHVNNGHDIMLPKVGHGFSVPRNWMPQFRQAYAMVTSAKSAEPPAATAPEVSDLPLVEVPATDSTSDLLAIHVTGDGGWGITDKGLAKDMAESGISVVGLNSLRYFWKERTPDEASQALARIIRYYMNNWKKDKVVISGYSLGADVLPFMINRLPDDLLSKIKMVSLIGPSSYVEFKFHLTDWLGRGPGKDAYQVKPEIEKLKSKRVICFYGQTDPDAICDQLDTSFVKVVPLEGGHLVRGNFDPVTNEILKDIKEVEDPASK